MCGVCMPVVVCIRMCEGRHSVFVRNADFIHIRWRRNGNMCVLYSSHMQNNMCDVRTIKTKIFCFLF